MASPSLCSIDQCATPFDVHCFHCRTNMCSQHYFEHKQKEEEETSPTDADDQAMDDLLQLAASKCFCITSRGTSKHRPKFSNPFVSSRYLLKKMRQRRRRVKPTLLTGSTAKIYNLRQRPTRCSKSILQSPETLCNQKLPCPDHPVR